MFKKFTLFLFTIIFLTGCMPTPIEKTKENNSQKSMISRSLTNLGNTYRVNKKIKSAKKGESLLVAFVGSSAFVANEENKSVSDYSVSKISELFKSKAEINVLNFSIYGANSTLGNIMLNKKVLSSHPDIIFLDYAIFDKHEQENRESFENIIRTCLSQENEPQIVIFLNAKSDGNVKQDFMEQIAKYYNLPIINVANAVLPEISSGRMKADTFFADKTTLTDEGMQIVADFTENYLKTAQKQRKDKSYTIPTPMYPNAALQNPKFIDAINIQADNDGSYVRTKLENQTFDSKIEYLTNTENNPFIFTVDANGIFLVTPVSNKYKDIVEIYVNGKKTQEINLQTENEQDIPTAFKIFSAAKPEKVAIAIKMKEEPKKDENLLEEIQQKEMSNETTNIEEKEENPVIDNKKDFRFFGIALTKNKMSDK